MADSLAKNPIALRQCLLYEFLQGKSAEKAFDGISETVGKNVMNKKEIQVWFRRFAKGKFYKNSRKHDKITVKDIFQSDKKALRTCILYLSLKSAKKTKENRYLMHSMDSREKHDLFRFNPSFVMYEKFRKVIGENVMEYLEFDFWFHRFAQGKLDLSYDRSLDPKPKELSDMPIDIIETVADYFSPMDRLIVRNVSRSLRALVENRIARYDFVCLYIRDDNMEMYMRTKPDSVSKNGSIDYNKQGDDCLMVNDGVERLVKGADPFQLAAEHLSIVLKNPEIKLDSIWFVGMYGNNAEAFTNLLKSALQNSMFIVNSLRLGDTSVGALLNILPCIVPHELVKISMEETWEGEEDDAKIAEIVETDQWKNAAYFFVEDMKSVPIDSVIHSDRFFITLNDVSPQEFVRIRELLYESPYFDIGVINCEGLELVAIQEALGPSIRPDRPEMEFYAIPGSTDFLSFFFGEGHVRIERHNSRDF